MDVQLKKGLLEACVLKVLCSGDSYGYRLIKDVSPYIEISESTLYPILRRLEGTGCLSVYSVEHEGRLRKYYCITDVGRERLANFREEFKEVLGIYEFIAGGNGNDQIGIY